MEPDGDVLVFPLGPGTKVDHFPDTKRMVLRVELRIFMGPNGPIDDFGKIFPFQ